MKSKPCMFCKENVAYVDYKDYNLLRRFISDRGKVRARRVTAAALRGGEVRAVQVILNQDVEKIGQRGDIVDVSRGYVRNFLVPRGLAEVATPAKLEEARRRMEESEERDRRLAERAEEISGILNKSVITIEARTGEDERLFGSVTAANIADAVERARGIRLDRRRIRLEEPIRALGTHQVPIQVHGEVEASVKVIVVPKL
jgi:large subunit ribosomal protein L9